MQVVWAGGLEPSDAAKLQGTREEPQVSNSGELDCRLHIEGQAQPVEKGTGNGGTERGQLQPLKL